MIPVAAAIALKITLVAGLALAATGLLRRSRASVRHALLAAAFAVLLAIPAVRLAGPQWRIALRMLTPLLRRPLELSSRRRLQRRCRNHPRAFPMLPEFHFRRRWPPRGLTACS